MSSPNNTALQAIPPATFTYLGQATAAGYIKGGVLIGDLVNDASTTPAGSTDNTPTVTLSGGVPISAQLELQSTSGALCIMRMTTTQRNALITVVDGMMIYNTSTVTFQFRYGGNWVSLSAGSGGVVGPGSSVANTVATYADTSGAVLADTQVVIDGSGNVSAVNSIANAVGTVSAPSYTFTAETDVGMWSSAAHTLDFSTNSLEALQLTAPQASAVNYLYITATATGAAPIIGPKGTDTNIGVQIVPKGSGGLTLTTGSFQALTGSITAGSSGHAGTVTSFPGTATEGSLILAAVSNSGGNFATTISNASSVGQAQVVSIPDGGASTANFIISASAAGSQSITTGNLLVTTGNLQAGSSGHAGTVSSFPATSAKGSLVLTAVANTGNTTTTISNDAMGQASTVNIPDPGNTVGQFLVGATSTPFVSGNFPQNSGTAGLMVDSGVSVSSVSGAVTQLGQLYQTSVTLNTAAVVAAYGTPQVLIAAVAGKVAIIHSANVYTASTGNTAFATGVAPIIQYGTTVHGAGTIAVGTGLVTGDITAATSQIRTIGPAASNTYTGITDTAVCFSCTTAYTAGTGTSVTFTLVYELITATV